MVDHGAVARTWVERWDRQQEHYIAEREERFQVIGDVVERVCAPVEAPLVVDLGCGPGSLSTRLHARVPHARIVGVDVHPFLLGLARHTRPAQASIDYVLTDLGEPGWTGRAGGDRMWDAAVSTTALHWLEPERLQGVYDDLATVIRPGGVLVNGDHLYPERPVLREIAEFVRERRAERAGVLANEDWATWWDEARSDAGLRAMFTEDELATKSGGHGNDLSARWHEDALLRAGFSDVGVVWQYGDDHVVVAVR
ncbi:class I SAM-dependent methyltransferase [Lentzea cavernae]|uniref:Methyltransferase n=1 Tax=Lentzea cavernae TaxID=2020703 RepID=A0ABQ3LYY4_9PSEU|nr:class I SAM-dependent methyltransferase [Lentzea cavernae]GHH27847.1 methyltransferase [Lentzea cavernae]